MLSYLQKYNELDQKLKDKVSTPEVMATIGELEKKYDISLATVIMRVMVRDISIIDLAKYFVFEHSWEAKQAEEMVEELKAKVFKDVADYLGFSVKPSDKLGTWMEEKEKETAVRGSNFFFSTEDEEEVQALAKKLGKYKKETQVAKEENAKLVQAKAEEVVKNMNLNFSSGDLVKRYTQVIHTYIKRVRNRVDTRQTLMKDVDTGGLDLNETLADNTIREADRIDREFEPGDIKEKVEGEEKPVPQSESAAPRDMTTRDTAYDFSKLKERAVPTSAQPQATPTAKAEEGKIKFSDEMELPLAEPEAKLESAPKRSIDFDDPEFELPSKDIPAPSTARLDIVTDDIKPKTKKFNAKPTKELIPPSVPAPPSTASGKVKMEDVKYVPKLTGPIDELKEMDLVNFRRLNVDPDLAAKKIIEKIKFLEENSFAERLKGIKAWRVSPVNKYYLKVGQTSINDNKDINTVIEEFKTRGEEILTNKEFSAIMRLNKDLRF